jgi:predicted SnoaL-like aldol condensation-catalyzing enzyme
MGTIMSTAVNKAIVKAFHGMALNNARPAEAVDRFVRARYVHYGPMVVGGKEAFIECFERLARDYPGKRVEFRHVIAEGDFVVLHCRHQWPDERDFDGIEIFRLDAFGNILGALGRHGTDSRALPAIERDAMIATENGPMKLRVAGNQTRNGSLGRGLSTWLLALSVAGCGRESTPTSPSEQSFLARHMARNRHDSGQPAGSQPIASDEWPNHVGVRGDAEHEPAIVQQHHSLGTPVATDHDHSDNGDLSEQHPANPDQHARDIHVTARLPWHVWQRRHRSGDADRSRLHWHRL